MLNEQLKILKLTFNFKEDEPCRKDAGSSFFIKEKEAATVDEWITLLTELSFPVAITFYLLHRIEGKLDVLNETIRTLPDKMK